MLVAVVGDGVCSAETAEVAAEVGRLLAEKKVTIICGGLGGVMQAVCRGAKGAGGLTVGILPTANRRDANPYVDIPIATGMGQARNVIVVSSAQSVIAISGGYGTLSEIAHALKLGIPVVGLGTWQLTKDDHTGLEVTFATGPRDAVEKALQLANP
jgi:uncharacterized protein (TIGR00725 family)